MEVASILISRLLSESVKRGARGLQLTVGSPPMFRIGGVIEKMEEESIVDINLIESIINSLVDEKEAERLKKEKEIVLVKNVAGDMRFRINIYYQKNLPSLSFRYIPNVTKNLEELNLPEVVHSFVEHDSGLIIVAGPLGSGKTSTVASIIEFVNNTKAKNILTIENPIEYLFNSKKSIISQREVGQDVNTFIDGLNFVFEQEVDLLYLSEIKKGFEEAMPIILDLASGNSLILLELSTNNAISAIEKMIEAASKNSSKEAVRYSLADNLIGIIVHKLFPKRGGGMVLANEIMIANSAVKSLIREGRIAQIESIIQTSRNEGMISMERSIQELRDKGKIV